jgi:hypothetical protein
MKDKILAQLKIKFAGVSNLILERVAENLAKTVTDETKIADAVTAVENSPVGINDIANLLQTEGDRRVTDLQKTHQTEIEKLKKQIPSKPAKEKETTTTDEEVPAWAKPLVDTISTMQTKLTAQETAAQRQALTAKLFADPKVKDIPNSFKNKYTIEKEEDLSITVDKIVTEFAQLQQEMVNKGTFVETPAGSTKQKDGEVSADAKVYIDHLKGTNDQSVGKPLVLNQTQSSTN